MPLPHRLRAALWAALAVVAAMGAPLLGRPLEDGHETGLVFTPRTFDFGAVRAGTLVRAEFAFSNPTGAPIRILQMHGTCGCVHAETSASYVEPGATGTVKAVVITEGRSGPQRLRVRVRTDEGAKGGTRLALEGEIKVALRPRPPRVLLGAVAPGSEHTAEIRVEKLEPVREVAVTPRGDGLSVEKLHEDERSLALRVTVNVPWARTRPGSGVLLAGGEGTTWIPVAWVVPLPFELSAREVEFVGGTATLEAKPRWPGVTLARVDTKGLPIAVARDGDRIVLTLEGSPLDVPSGASIELVPEPASLGRVAVPVSARLD